MGSYLNSEIIRPPLTTASKLWAGLSRAFNIRLRSPLVCRDSFLVSDLRLLCIVRSYDRDRQRLSQPDAQSLSKVTPVDVGWLYADIRDKKQTSQWQAVQAGLQPGLDRPVGWSFSARALQPGPFRSWLRCDRDQQRVPVDLIFPSRRAFRRRERGDLIEDTDFDTLARFSFSERTLQAPGTPRQLR
jgi:hypothetical protein